MAPAYDLYLALPLTNHTGATNEKLYMEINRKMHTNFVFLFTCKQQLARQRREI